MTPNKPLASLGGWPEGLVADRFVSEQPFHGVAEVILSNALGVGVTFENCWGIGLARVDRNGPLLLREQVQQHQEDALRLLGCDGCRLRPSDRGDFRLNRFDDAGRNRIVMPIAAEFDDLEPGQKFQAGLAVLRKLELGDDVVDWSRLMAT
jgi:hypothetical protein